MKRSPTLDRLSARYGNKTTIAAVDGLSPLYLGIDPGLSGAVVFLTEDDVVESYTTPVLVGDTRKKTRKREVDGVVVSQTYDSKSKGFDIPAMRDLLSARQPRIKFAVLELVGAVGKMRGVTQSPKSMFGFGEGFGMWQAILVCLNIPYRLVRPQEWQKAILKGTAQDKLASIKYAQSRYPDANLLASPRCRVPSDGITDAICIADFARREHRGR